MQEIEAIRYAENIGVYEFRVNGEWIEYWSFFPGEGFRFIQHNLKTGEENRDGFIPWVKEDGRPIPRFLLTNSGATKYNYNVG